MYVYVYVTYIYIYILKVKIRFNTVIAKVVRLTRKLQKCVSEKIRNYAACVYVKAAREIKLKLVISFSRNRTERLLEPIHSVSNIA